MPEQNPKQTQEQDRQEDSVEPVHGAEIAKAVKYTDDGSRAVPVSYILLVGGQVPAQGFQQIFVLVPVKIRGIGGAQHRF